MELEHPDGILYFSDWVFMHYRLYQLNLAFTIIAANGAGPSEAFISSKNNFVKNAAANLNLIEKSYLNRHFLFAFPAIDNEEWKSTISFTSSQINGNNTFSEDIITFLETELREKVAKIGKLPNNISNVYIGNMNYGVRLWKNLLGQQIPRILSFFNYQTSNLLGLKLACSIVMETVSAIYFKYKAIEPSRARNTNYIYDLRFILDTTIHHLKIVFGLTVLQLSLKDSKERKTWNTLMIFLVGTLNYLWWIVKSMKSQLAILEASPHELGEFLQECIDGNIPLSVYSEEKETSIKKEFEQVRSLKISTE